MNKIKAFNPVYDGNSRLLILGSFPSVKSRSTHFYYGNKQNRFWKTVCSYFGESIPQTTDDKVNFLLKHNIALWDIVAECEIEGSKDDTIKNFSVSDVNRLLQNSKIRYIILNGSKAHCIFCKYYGDIEVPYCRLPSTSPANTHFNEKEWYDALSAAFRLT